MDIVVCFALFLAAMLFCLVKGFSLAWALLFALVLFFALGLRRGYGAKALVKMAWSKMPKSMIVLRILFFIGLLTGLWRSCGTIAFFIYHGIRVITPSLFILVAFLLTVLLSYALGTSFGVASTAGVVLMALARSGGVSEAVTAGVILSGIYFGDRGAPTSSCASLVAALTETDLYGNVRRMFQTAALPYALCLVAYTVLSFRNPIVTVDETMLDASPRALSSPRGRSCPRSSCSSCRSSACPSAAPWRSPPPRPSSSPSRCRAAAWLTRSGSWSSAITRPRGCWPPSSPAAGW